jgi:hypothetical protein
MFENSKCPPNWHQQVSEFLKQNKDALIAELQKFGASQTTLDKAEKRATGPSDPNWLGKLAIAIGAVHELPNGLYATEVVIENPREGAVEALSTDAKVFDIAAMVSSLLEQYRQQSLYLMLSAMGYLGISLSFFHVVALVIVLGLSVDYALFFLESSASGQQQVVSLTVVLSTLSTVLAFLPLCFSSSGILRGLGGTLGFGILLATVLAPMAGREAKKGV